MPETRRRRAFNVSHRDETDVLLWTCDQRFLDFFGGRGRGRAIRIFRARGNGARARRRRSLPRPSKLHRPAAHSVLANLGHEGAVEAENVLRQRSPGHRIGRTRRCRWWARPRPLVIFGGRRVRLLPSTTMLKCAGVSPIVFASATSARALRRSTCPCTRKPPRTFTDCGVKTNVGPSREFPATQDNSTVEAITAPALELGRRRSRFRTSRARAAFERIDGRSLVRTEGKIDNDAGARALPRTTAFAVGDHHVERKTPTVRIEAVDHHAQTVAHEQQIDMRIKGSRPSARCAR